MTFKESVLYVGGDSSGKTSSLFEIAAAHPDVPCFLIDLENKSGKIHAGLYPEVTNVVVQTAVNWDQLADAYEAAKKLLVPTHGEGWLFVDGLDKAWDMVQADYEMKVNKINLADQIEALRLGTTQSGIDKWGWAKTKHNAYFMDVATGPAPFHVAMTTQIEPWVQEIVAKEKDDFVRDALQAWGRFGFRPGGEKRNVSRFDTVFALKVDVGTGRPKYQVATYKDKVRPYLSGDKTLWTTREFPLWGQYVRACEEALSRGERVIMPA